MQKINQTSVRVKKCKLSLRKNLNPCQLAVSISICSVSDSDISGARAD